VERGNRTEHSLRSAPLRSPIESTTVPFRSFVPRKLTAPLHSVSTGSAARNQQQQPFTQVDFDCTGRCDDKMWSKKIGKGGKRVISQTKHSSNSVGRWRQPKRDEARRGDTKSEVRPVIKGGNDNMIPSPVSSRASISVSKPVDQSLIINNQYNSLDERPAMR